MWITTGFSHDPHGHWVLNGHRAGVISVPSPSKPELPIQAVAAHLTAQDEMIRRLTDDLRILRAHYHDR